MCWSLACLVSFSQSPLLCSVLQIFVSTEFWLHLASYRHWWVWERNKSRYFSPSFSVKITFLAVTLCPYCYWFWFLIESHCAIVPAWRAVDSTAHEATLLLCSDCTPLSYCPFCPRDIWYLPAFSNVCASWHSVWLPNFFFLNHFLNQLSMLNASVWSNKYILFSSLPILLKSGYIITS